MAENYSLLFLLRVLMQVQDVLNSLWYKLTIVFSSIFGQFTALVLLFMCSYAIRLIRMALVNWTEQWSTQMRSPLQSKHSILYCQHEREQEIEEILRTAGCTNCYKMITFLNFVNEGLIDLQIRLWWYLDDYMYMKVIWFGYCKISLL